MSEPAISVIVPCFNVAPYLPRSLESFLRQTWTDFEIIAVDDGSTDETPQVLQSWALRDSRIRVVQQDNTGLYLARLSGIRHARAPWITFMDADDEVMPHHLEALRGGADDQTGVVVGGIVAVSPDGRETGWSQ